MVGSSQAGSGIGNKFSQCLACFLSGQKFGPKSSPRINRLRLDRVDRDHVYARIKLSLLIVQNQLAWKIKV